MNDAITPSKIILLVLQLLLDDDIDMDELFAHAGVPLQNLLADDGIISSADVLAISNSAKTLTDDPALGLHLGEEMGIEMLDMVGMLASSAPNLREALTVVVSNSHLLTSMGRAQLLEEGDSARFVLTVVDDLASINAYCVEIVYAAFWNMTRRLVKGSLTLQRISVQGPMPAWHDEYPRVFGEEVEFVFNAPENSLAFERRLLDLPMARHSSGLYQRLQEQAAKRLASRPQPESTAAVAQHIIDNNMSQRLLDLPTVAELMGLSPRSLQRRLKDENTSFQKVYDARRQRLAEELLLERSTNIETIAAMLGYSEPANFYRAFKHWCGLSPNEFRRQHSES